MDEDNKGDDWREALGSPDYRCNARTALLDLGVPQDLRAVPVSDMKLAIAILITWLIGLGFVLAAVVRLAIDH